MLTLLADNVCIESLSIDLTRPMLDTAARNVETLTEKIAEWVFQSRPPLEAACSQQPTRFRTLRIKEKDASKLEDEYRRLVEGLQQSEEHVEDEDFMANPGSSHRSPRHPFDSVSRLNLNVSLQCSRKICFKRRSPAISAERSTLRRSSRGSSSTSR